jgi:hypothetical protein
MTSSLTSPQLAARTLDPVVGISCFFCFGRQQYRAGFNPIRRVKVKCRYCGQGESEMDEILDPACGTGSFLCVEIKGAAVKDGVYTTPPEVLEAVSKRQVAEYAEMANPPYTVLPCP